MSFKKPYNESVACFIAFLKKNLYAIATLDRSLDDKDHPR